MTVQTTVEVPQLLGVPVAIPQAQFLDKFDTTVLLACCRVLFDKVVDVPVVLCNGVLQVGFVMSDIDIFVSSMSIFTLDHMNSLKDIPASWRQWPMRVVAATAGMMCLDSHHAHLSRCRHAL